MSTPETRLRKMIASELKRTLQKEAVDFEGAKVVVNAASKLLKAAMDFKENANGAMGSATTPHLDTLVNVLEQMIGNPASYTDKVKVEPKRVKLRAVKEDKGYIPTSISDGTETCPKCGEQDVALCPNGLCDACDDAISWDNASNARSRRQRWTRGHNSGAVQEAKEPLHPAVQQALDDAHDFASGVAADLGIEDASDPEFVQLWADHHCDKLPADVFEKVRELLKAGK